MTSMILVSVLIFIVAVAMTMVGKGGGNFYVVILAMAGIPMHEAAATGQFILPGLMKIEVKRKPATKARKGINPFTGEETMFKAKPARNVVKVRPLKKLKDMVA